MKILLTGATGFVGQHLFGVLKNKGHDVRCAVRKTSSMGADSDFVVIDDIGPDTDWSDALDSIELVIHLAGYTGLNSLTSNNELNRINVDGTHNLAVQASNSGVNSFIFLSTIKVYGEELPENILLSESSETGNGCDTYGASKLAAEEKLIETANTSEMNFVIIRSPLVYGPGVKANFQSLIKMLGTGIPLPFSGIKNNRSMIALENLVDFIQCCITNAVSNNQVYLISDDDDISLPRLIKLIRCSQEVPLRLFYFPVGLLKGLASLFGKSKRLGKLVGSVQLDINKAKTQLGWTPRVNVDDSIKKTVIAYRESE